MAFIGDILLTIKVGKNMAIEQIINVPKLDKNEFLPNPSDRNRI